jgi:hypothetical protein
MAARGHESGQQDADSRRNGMADGAAALPDDRPIDTTEDIMKNLAAALAAACLASPAWAFD